MGALSQQDRAVNNMYVPSTWHPGASCLSYLPHVSATASWSCGTQTQQLLEKKGRKKNNITLARDNSMGFWYNHRLSDTIAEGMSLFNICNVGQGVASLCERDFIFLFRAPPISPGLRLLGVIASRFQLCRPKPRSSSVRPHGQLT